MCAERPIRYSLKVLQFVSSAFVVYCLFRTGPHWMLTLACLVVPPFGIYLMLKSPDQKKHKVPHRIYWAVAKGKSWLRVDATICLTMSVVFFGFAIILFYGFFKLVPQNVYLLFAGLGSLLVSSLYLINAIVSIGQLRSGTVDFASTIITQRMALPKADNSQPNSLSKNSSAVQPKLKPDSNELKVQVDQSNANDANKSIDDPTSVNYRSNNLLLKTTDSYPYGKHKSNTSSSSRTTHPLAEQPEMDQKIIDFIKEQLDESLDREYSNNTQSVSVKETSRKYRYAPSRILQTNQGQHLAARQRFDSGSIGSLSELARRTPPPIDTPPPVPPPALPIRPPPLLNSFDEVRRIAQFNEGFVASEASTPLENRSTAQERRTLNGFAMCISNVHTTVKAGESKNMNEGSSGVVAAPIGQRGRRFTTKSNDSSNARRRFSRGEENTLKAPRAAEKSSDDDSTSVSGSGSLGSAVHEYENSTTLERSNSDIAILSSIVAMNEDAAARRWQEAQRRSREMATTSGIHDGTRRIRRNSTPHSYYMKRVYRHCSHDGQFANYGFIDSDEDNATYRKHSNTLPSAHISALTHQLGGSFDPSCIPSIVTAIDSSRESDIMRHNSPRRTSSRARKMSGKRGFDVVIRAQSENDIAERRTNEQTTMVNERPVDAFFVTEF
ncbi:hypothetical protein Tcan_13525 [Toxocara canis]|uniref:Uncharacterized protein n=1 Tax=Toxocara canis TaxID=6265 RepID=A0A0B2VPJ5_TOXCA|nr:hypothetical protein Tcan_13525 [Toxocara canis]